MAEDVRPDAGEDLLQRPPGVARDDEHVEADRRRHQADFGDDDDDDAEPDRIEAERLDQRQHDRNRQDRGSRSGP